MYRSTMTEHGNPNDPTGAEHPGLPRWVKAMAIIVAVAVLLALAATLIAGIDHGPGRHGTGPSLGQAMPR
jgi:hypothetical protein